MNTFRLRRLFALFGFTLLALFEQQTVMAQKSDIAIARFSARVFDEKPTPPPTFIGVQDANSTMEPSVLHRAGSSLVRNIQYRTCWWYVWHTSDGSPVPGVQFTITITSIENTGGHQHQNRRHGWLKKKFDVTTFPQDDGPSGSTTPNTITVTTGQDGKAPWYYIAPEDAGTEVLQSTSPMFSSLPDWYWDIKIATPLTSFSTVTDISYYLFGETPGHPDNHYATQGFIDGLRATSKSYTQAQTDSKAINDAINAIKQMGRQNSGDKAAYDFPSTIPNGAKGVFNYCPESPEILFINDISLMWGGLFDENKTWLPPHLGHRDGKQADIKSILLISGDPYTVDKSGQIVGYPDKSSAVGDSRLIEAKKPFRDTDWFTGKDGTKTYYTPSIRAAINKQVMSIHYNRLLLLLASFPAGTVFRKESDHIHANLP